MGIQAPAPGRAFVRSVFRGLLLLGLVPALGCGTTRVTDTQRTATEQLLVSTSVDQAVSQLDFRVLAGKAVYFDHQYLDNAVDRGYLISSIRQHLLANGCLLQEDRTKASYVVEARAGAVGTDRHALLFGVPQMTVPTLVPGQPSQIPELPFAKKTDQKGVAKIAVFAYNRVTGRPVWQSGVVEAASSAKDAWVLGAGPFQYGTIRERTEFAGQPLQEAFFGRDHEEESPKDLVPVSEPAAWQEPPPPKLVVLGGQWVIPVLPAADKKNSAPAPAPAPMPPPVAPNAGGQAETQPARMVISGLGVPVDK
jgi:hypothetical protein